jgi:carboxypeptidase family protein
MLMSITYRIRLLATLAFVLTAGCASLCAACPQEDGNLDITIRGPNNEAVPGANVEAVRHGCACKDCGVLERPCKCCVQQATSNDEGRVTLRVHEGVYTVRVTAEGFRQSEQADIKVGAGEAHSLEMRLARPPGLANTTSAQSATNTRLQQMVEDKLSIDSRRSSIKGEIVDENKRALPDVELVFMTRGCKCDSCPDDEKPCKCCIAQRAVSDASGRYSISVESGTYDLKILVMGRSAGSINGVEINKSNKVDLTIVNNAASSRKPE